MFRHYSRQFSLYTLTENIKCNNNDYNMA